MENLKKKIKHTKHSKHAFLLPATERDYYQSQESFVSGDKVYEAFNFTLKSSIMKHIFASAAYRFRMASGEVHLMGPISLLV